MLENTYDDILRDLGAELEKIRNRDSVADEEKYYWAMFESNKYKFDNIVIVAYNKEQAQKSIEYLKKRGYELINEGFSYQWDLPIYTIGIHFNLKLR